MQMEDTNAKAKARMRRLRAAGPTLSDRARNMATSALVKAHAEEYQTLRRQFYVQLYNSAKG